MFYSSCAEVSSSVTAVHNLPGHNHVTGWATGVGEVNFLHNYYFFLQVVVHKLNLEVGTIFCTPPVPVSL